MTEDKFSCEHLLDKIDELRSCIVDRQNEGKINRYEVSRILPTLDSLMQEVCDFSDNY